MSIRKAMIFAAGLGTRFKPWTEMHPKALAPGLGARAPVDLPDRR